MTVLQPDELFACLDRHQVQYVLIGGLAAVLHGSPLPTVDADICPSRDRENLTRLSRQRSESSMREFRSADTPTGVRCSFQDDACIHDSTPLITAVTTAVS